MLAQIMETFKFIWNHPLNDGQRLRALSRFFSWQIESRMSTKPAVCSWVNGNVFLIIERGMTAATGNMYVGLMEFEQMAFVLHYLRPRDVFFDIGANIGSYALLAGKAVGAQCLALEPIPETFGKLMNNVFLNQVQDRVSALNIGVGKAKGELHFSAGLDTMNHVLSETDLDSSFIKVEVLPIDEACGGLCPEVIKIDVEGFESEVVAGGKGTFASTDLNVVLMELQGYGSRYGFDEHAIDRYMKDLNFKACTYDPFLRTVTKRFQDDGQLGDMLYIRDIEKAQQRVSTASRFKVNKKWI